MLVPFSDEYFMKQAYHEAEKAFEKGEIPVGAVVVCNQQIIARAHNLTECLNDVTAHAEIQVLTAAFNFLGAKYLNTCTLYVTLEPCVMCAGALYWSQIQKVIFACRDEKRGAGRFKQELYHPKTLVQNGLMEKECRSILKNFFELKRI
ncbi:MAG: nucleoside deaminase [Flavobacteriia bacterium]|nr:nucleoside deaminase [Flavobacteriia bacterium]